jgi:hypothetical protein
MAVRFLLAERCDGQTGEQNFPTRRSYQTINRKERLKVKVVSVFKYLAVKTWEVVINLHEFSVTVGCYIKTRGQIHTLTFLIPGKLSS